MELTFFGTSHGAPEVGRFCSGTLLETNGLSYLIDCGAPVDALMLNAGKKFEVLRAIFITHMHEDHMGTLPAMVKEFDTYHPTSKCDIFFAEESAIEPFIAWETAMHRTESPSRIAFKASHEGIMYDDGNIRVRGILTDHIKGFPTFAYAIDLLSEGKKILFSGDMRSDLADFPKVAWEEHWNCIVSELTHYRIENCVDILAKSNTDKLIFNHKNKYNLSAYPSVKSQLPFESVIACDGDRFII